MIPDTPPEWANLLIALLAIATCAGYIWAGHISKTKPFLLLALGAFWLSIVRIGVLWEGSFFDRHLAWLVLPSNIVYAAGAVWLGFLLHSWYGKDGSRTPVRKREVVATLRESTVTAREDTVHEREEAMEQKENGNA